MHSEEKTLISGVSTLQNRHRLSAAGAGVQVHVKTVSVGIEKSGNVSNATTGMKC